MTKVTKSPAEQAAQKALTSMYASIDKGKSFLLEAGAGAGKTYSLIKALKYLIEKKGADLIRYHQKVACISYTNIASEEITSRIDRHPAIHSSTIHSFCWSMISDFQPYLRNKLPVINDWSEKLEEIGGIGLRRIGYDEFGHRTLTDTNISLHHDDVLTLTIELMKQHKFRQLFVSRYPILFIDEYQDTDKGIAEALRSNFIDSGKGPLIGFFGDHWQKIYESVCGKIEHPAIEVIGKKANFRSVSVIVDCLNRMRPELPQYVKDPGSEGFVGIYHTNAWIGERRTGQHWAGDLPADVAHDYLEFLTKRLTNEGWEFEPDKAKILMLTHKVLASEQGYSNLAQVFTRNEAYIKKEDPHIAFLVDTLEPVCTAYENKRVGEMFTTLVRRTPLIRSHNYKLSWTKDLDKLIELRATGSVGAVLDHLKESKHIHVPDAIDRKERELKQFDQNPSDEEPFSIARLRKLRNVSYQEIIALDRYIDGYTPFSTKHGVKGAEFENVLVVVGRGWSRYNFNEFLEWAGDPDIIPYGRQEAFERNRNLFYVSCSRPKKRLAILFTQKLSDKALMTLGQWFGSGAIHPLHIGN